MKKVAVLIGHRENAQGAHSTFLGATEFTYMSIVAEHLFCKANGYELDIYKRPNTPFVKEVYRINQVINQVNRKHYDLVLSLHFNSFHNDAAHGCTALHYITNQRTKKIAQRFNELVADHFNIKSRDLIPIKSKSQRGGTFIINSYADAVLLEPFFGSNPSDAYSFRNKEYEYAILLDELIKEAL